jgi:hypothetical protein
VDAMASCEHHTTFDQRGRLFVRGVVRGVVREGCCSAIHYTVTNPHHTILEVR